MTTPSVTAVLLDLPYVRYVVYTCGTQGGADLECEWTGHDPRGVEEHGVDQAPRRVDQGILCKPCKKVTITSDGRPDCRTVVFNLTWVRRNISYIPMGE